MSNAIIRIGHGSGGRLSQELIREVFLSRLGHVPLAALNDAALLDLPRDAATPSSLGPCPGTLAFTTDSYVVRPLCWPGGNIGRLSVCGTVNDLAVMGARPLWLSAGFILEEGLLISVLEEIVDAMASAAAEAGVAVVTGDTKVVHRGEADQLFVTTAGVGIVPQGRCLGGQHAVPGDVVIVSGYLGDHGMAVLSQREGLAFGGDIESDVAPLNSLVEQMFAASPDIHVLRDPTRGGLATTLNEISSQSAVSVWLREQAIPVRESVTVACEMLGYDPLYVANEGKLVAVVAPHAAEAVLDAMRAHPLGREAAAIGAVRQDQVPLVVLNTRLGGTRILGMLAGEMLPRIC